MLMSDLTKREMLAGMAMQGLISSHDANPSMQVNVEASVRFADALLAELEKTAPKPATDDDGWIAHKPGDPMPCDGNLTVEVRLKGKEKIIRGTARFFRDGCLVNDWAKDGRGTPSREIIAWRPAR